MGLLPRRRSTSQLQVIVADGTPEATRRLERVLITGPGMGVVRHADAGYPEAIQAARRHGLKMPMLHSWTRGNRRTGR